VFDVSGRTVAVIADRTFGRGYHSVEWTGRDETGRTVPSGTYVVQMETGDGAETQKVSLVR
jgi:flagellar hook assembly protein FlgD